jgi:hypothetical protein
MRLRPAVVVCHARWVKDMSLKRRCEMDRDALLERLMENSAPWEASKLLIIGAPAQSGKEARMYLGALQ